MGCVRAISYPLTTRMWKKDQSPSSLDHTMILRTRRKPFITHILTLMYSYCCYITVISSHMRHMSERRHRTRASYQPYLVLYRKPVSEQRKSVEMLSHGKILLTTLSMSKRSSHNKNRRRIIDLCTVVCFSVTSECEMLPQDMLLQDILLDIHAVRRHTARHTCC